MVLDLIMSVLFSRKVLVLVRLVLVLVLVVRDGSEVQGRRILGRCNEALDDEVVKSRFQ